MKHLLLRITPHIAIRCPNTHSLCSCHLLHYLVPNALPEMNGVLARTQRGPDVAAALLDRLTTLGVPLLGCFGPSSAEARIRTASPSGLRSSGKVLFFPNVPKPQGVAGVRRGSAFIRCWCK